MSDIQRNKPLVLVTGHLAIKHKDLQINEKRAEIEAIDLRIKDLERIHLKKLQYAKDFASEELKKLEGEIEKMRPIDV